MGSYWLGNNLYFERQKAEKFQEPLKIFTKITIDADSREHPIRFS